MNAAALAAAVLAATAAVGALRLVLWAARSPGTARPAPWRLGLLLAGQPLLAGLLFVALFPPPGGGGGDGGVLVIATRSAPLAAAASGEHLVSLPEAPAGVGGERVPDLSTALRHHPDVVRLRVVGAGLTPRDREAVLGRGLAFRPSPPPRGLVELHAPATTAPGDAFEVAGRVERVAGGLVELRDPAGSLVDRQATAAGGGFRLRGAAREPGAALFAVVVRDRATAVVDRADVPLVTEAAAPPRVLLLAGAPGPEVKALRRWSLDSGVALRTVVSAGAGLDLGDARPALTPAVLDALDLVVVDDRSWGDLSPADRAALAAAVQDGLGLLLRVTAPPALAVRDQWRALGLPLPAGEGAAAARAPAPPSPAASAATAEVEAPVLTRRGVDAPAPGSAPLLRDADGAVLARWRPRGEGRLGVWTVSDSSGLATAGFGDRYGELWAALFGGLARPAARRAASLSAWPTAGRRVTLCGLTGEADVLGPAGPEARVLPDPRSGAAGCGGYWPAAAGWRRLRLVEGGGAAREQPFYVHRADEAPGVVALQDALATQALAADAAAARPVRAPRSPHDGPSWPWLLLWFAAATALWWLERARFGRAARGEPRTEQVSA